MVDIRIPIGLMFAIIGIIISIMGLVTVSDAEMYRKSLGVNVNLIMGAFMLIFGLVMLYFALRKKKA
jgi:uncharacterized membrane protein